jgi:flagellar basal-body rod protein FlgF
METSILVALSRQDTLARQLDVVANNLANMNTTAFKAERMMFADYLVQVGSADGATGDAIAFVRDFATVRDPSEGKLEETGGDLDVALAGEGYLVVQTPQGERYTRDGHLRLDEAGQLVTDDGLPVLRRVARRCCSVPKTRGSPSPATARCPARRATSDGCGSSASPTPSGCTPSPAG